MRLRPLLLVLALLSSALATGVLSGCQGKTPEEVEASKYPAAKPLSAEEQAKARELTQTKPPTGGSR